MISKRHEIIPFEGTNQIKLGTDRTVARKMLSELYSRSFRRGQVEFDDFNWFHLSYDSDNKIDAIEFFDPSEVYFQGTNLINLDKNECRNILMEVDPDLELESDVGMTSKKFQLGVYAPYELVESVLVGVKNYYH